MLYPLSYGGSGGTTIPAAPAVAETGVGPGAEAGSIRQAEVGRGRRAGADTLAR